MSARSWLLVPDEEPHDALPADLRARDPWGAVDVGLVAQMRLLLTELAPGRDARVLDPFAGFGSTLVACARAGLCGVGVELDAARARLAVERLARVPDAEAALTRRALIVGDARALPLPPSSFDLALTNLPYFTPRGAPNGAVDGHLYAARDYGAYLALLDAAIADARRVVRPGGLVVACVQNVRSADGTLLPLAWDAARLVAARLRLVDERVLVYPRAPAHRDVRTPPTPDATDRSHEYVLTARVPP